MMVYQAVSILITAVPIKTNYEEMKAYYHQVLLKNINKLDELKHSFDPLADIYQDVEDLLNYVLANQRL